MAQGFPVQLPNRLFDADGAPGNAWRITTSVAGTVTPLTTYSDAQLLSANTNPIIADTAGYFRCFVAAGVLVKIAVANASSVLQFTLDNLEPMLPASGTGSVTAVPTGGMIGFPIATPPTGFLYCNGALVSRATFAALFAVMGIGYGAGDGVTTFALPDFRGRYAMGVATAGTGNTVGATFGAIDHTHTGPSHTHAVVVPRDGWGVALNIPATTGRMSTGDAAGAGQFASAEQSSADQSVTSAAGGTGATGTANPPTLTLFWMVKT